jgi:hypothetical protein
MDDNLSTEVDKDASGDKLNFSEGYTIEALIGKSHDDILNMSNAELEKYFSNALIKETVAHAVSRGVGEGGMKLTSSLNTGFSGGGYQAKPKQPKLTKAQQIAKEMEEMQRDLGMLDNLEARLKKGTTT